MKSVLVLGAGGMAGHVIASYLRELGDTEVFAAGRKPCAIGIDYLLDVTDSVAVKKTIAESRPDYIINCVGLLNKVAEDNPADAIFLNAYLPHMLARLCANNGSRLIHISTDCVFNGKKGGYCENSPKDGEGYYAQTKALGEVGYGNNLTIRTSIIGPELNPNGIGLLNWFMAREGTIKGYSGARWTGVTTLELARAIHWYIISGSKITGVHHLVNGSVITKLELLNLFNEVFERGLTIETSSDYVVDKSLIPATVPFYPVGTYRQMLTDLKGWMATRQDLYNYSF